MGQETVLKPFNKPWTSCSQQVEILQQRGLIVEYPVAAEQFLSHLSYFRFSGYCLSFESQRHEFITGTTFQHVVDLHQFDLTLRDLITEALEIVEVDLRSAIAHEFGSSFGAFGHTNPNNFFQSPPRHAPPGTKTGVRPGTFSHSQWLDGLHRESKRSREIFVDHFESTYAEFPDLPVWVATEIMSFGTLSHMLEGMHSTTMRRIAARYHIQSSFLPSWVHHCSYVRNLCAHHSRLWDRIWAIKPDLPPFKAWQPPLLPSNQHLYSTLLILRKLLTEIPSMSSFAKDWKLRIERHISTMPLVAHAFHRMGLTNHWTEHPIWQSEKS